MAYRRTLLVAFSGLLMVFTLAGLSGCAMVPPNSFIDPTKVGRFGGGAHEGGIRRVLTPRDAPPGVPNAVEPMADDLVPTAEEYRLLVGDAISVTINDLLIPGGPPFSAGLLINPLGEIRLPELGTVKIVGLTEQEVEQELRRRLIEAELLPDPVVMVFAQVRRGRTFTILGAVSAAGTYSIPGPDTRLLDVFGMVGDIAPTAKRLYVIRQVGDQYAPAESEPITAVEPPAAQKQAPAEEWVIPPEWEEETETQFSSEAALVRRGQQPPPEQPPTKTELEDIFAPTVTSTQPDASEQARPAKAKFEPLIFDPETGQLQQMEPPVVREPAPPGEETVEDILEEPFDWDEIGDQSFEQRVIEVNVPELKNGNPRYNIVVRSRDVINVPVDTGVFYMMGEISRPGVYAFGGRDITIKQAIAVSGGFSPLAWPQRCEVIRREPGTDKQLTMTVDLDAIFAGLEDDFYLRDEDIVNVGTHIVAPFLFVLRNSFRFTYGFGFVFDRNFADQYSYGSRINPETLAREQRLRRGLPF